MTADNELAIVELRCIPDNPNAIAGVLNTKKVRFDIVTKSKGETIKRTPLNLVLILDRSGSPLVPIYMRVQLFIRLAA